METFPKRCPRCKTGLVFSQKIIAEKQPIEEIFCINCATRFYPSVEGEPKGVANTPIRPANRRKDVFIYGKKVRDAKKERDRATDSHPDEV